jgi:NADP-dependent 3-hydroxy acid dehydrogenase YdfG
MIIGPALGADTEDWERMIAINLLGLVHTTHAALPHLVQAAES